MPETTTGPVPDNAATTAFPTFLDEDPYPTKSRDGRPVSSAASVATDATSDFGGEDYKSAKERQSNMTGLTGPVGEPGLPPSRPTSVGTSVQSAQTARGGARNSLQPPNSRKGISIFSGSSRGDGSRPNSSMSKTHVPTLTAQGFFRPMSSSKLQAQRGQQPLTKNGQSSANTVKGQEDQVQRARRYSNASVNTLRDAKAAAASTKDEDIPPVPVSRGTQFTTDGEVQAEITTTASVSSATPLQTRANPPAKLEVNGLRSSNTPSAEKAPKSPRSFRASLGIGSKRSSKQEQNGRPSPKHHEKLESNPSSPQDAEKQFPMPSTKEPVKGSGKNYEYFAGNMLFFLSGRCMNTKAKPLNVITFILTVLPAALFFAFSAPWLWHNVSPALPILFAYFFAVTISSFLHGAMSDPGILPRNMHPHPPNPDEDRDPLTVGPATTEWIMVKTFPSSHRSPLPNRPNNSATENGTVNQQGATAMEVPTKYCKSCNIWRPPRAHHCRVCDACIETQDHHCVWLNNCVGRRNYRYFFSYVAFGSVLAFMLLAFSITHVALYANQNGISFAKSLTGRTQERMAFAMFIYSLLALPYPASLFTYHLFLIARGETTREYLNSHKFMKKDRHRPFAQSLLLQNWISVLIRPRPPTYMQFKHRYDEGDTRFGHTLPKKERKRDLRNRYSVQGVGPTAVGGGGGGGNGMGNGNGTKTDVEMKQLSPNPAPAQGQQQQTMKPQARAPGGNVTGIGGPGGMSGPMDRTPR